jgi:hypothetical protein
MASRSWRASGAAARAPGHGARPAGSWPASVERARQSWDDLAGRPVFVSDEARCDCGAARRVRAPGGAGVHVAACAGILSSGRYSDLAAAAILACAATLWADTSASMGEEEDGDDGQG